MKSIKRLSAALLAMTAVLSAAVSCSQSHPQPESSSTGHRSIYYWKTTFEIGEKEQAFLDGHGIDRIYLRMFDVDVRNDYSSDTATVVPVGTARFISAKPENIEIVPTVFITLQALSLYEGREQELAGLITKRVLNMCSYNELGPVSEVQFDCDWNASTRGSFDTMCEAAKKILHEQGMLLSGTIRLHQVEQAVYPFDKGVLMLYNTGAIKDPETSNSIIDYRDVKMYLGVGSRVQKFLKARKRNCPVIDFAYPTFHWNVVFDNYGSFNGIISEIDYDACPLEPVEGGFKATGYFTVGSTTVWQGETIRPEYSRYSEVMKVKRLVGETLGSAGSNILYHLDTDNLSKYSDNEIEDILR